MSYQELEAAMRPMLVDVARTSLGGSGSSKRIYHLRGDWQFAVTCDGYPDLDKVVAIHDAEPKKPWRGYRWEPDEVEQKTAVDLAAESLRRELSVGKDPAERYPINPAGRLVTPDKFAVELEIAPGKKSKLTAAAVEGRWQTHKLIRVDFFGEGVWLYQVDVDLSDRKAVPSQWTPAAQDVAQARTIADPAVEEFLKQAAAGNSKVAVRGWGNYDYGPLRRLLVLAYSKQEGGREVSRFVEVDFDNLKLNQSDDSPK
ncbi:MAG: hypothetical protein QM775_25765 [Pirellulales bacterium]